MNERIRTLYKNFFEVRHFPKAFIESKYDINKKKIIGVYHILCVNDWPSLVTEQIRYLKESGLLSQTKTLYISAIIKEYNDVEIIKKIVDTNNKLDFIYIGYDTSVYEYPALEFIYNKAQEDDFYVYYFHTKGISYQKEKSMEYPSKDFKQLKKNTNAWRRMMEYFIFERYNYALKALQTYDAYGCYYRDPIVPPFHYKYYAGNFWWSKSEYIKYLPPITTEIKGNRYLAENWLLQNSSKIYSSFNTSAELYAIYIPEILYKRKDIYITSLIEFIKFYISHYNFIIKKYFLKIFLK